MATLLFYIKIDKPGGILRLVGLNQPYSARVVVYSHRAYRQGSAGRGGAGIYLNADHIRIVVPVNHFIIAFLHNGVLQQGPRADAACAHGNGIGPGAAGGQEVLQVGEPQVRSGITIETKDRRYLRVHPVRTVGTHKRRTVAQFTVHVAVNSRIPVHRQRVLRAIPAGTHVQVRKSRPLRIRRIVAL